MKNQQGRRLDSWKAIAAYLDRDVRTAMRWEKEGGMPVHRVPGARRGGSVFAYSSELDGWLARGAPNGGATTDGKDTEPNGSVPGFAGVHGFALVAGALTVVAVIVVAVSLLSVGDEVAKSSLPIASIEATRTAIVARDVDDGVAWALEHPRGWGFNGESIDRVVDVGAGPGKEVLVMAETFDPTRQAFLQGELFAFSVAGDLLWHLQIGDRLEFGAGSYAPPWASMAFEPVLLDGVSKLAWAVHHYTWWPSMLALVSDAGVLEASFVNSGWITRVAALGRAGGDVVLAGGISNSQGGAMLAVLSSSSFPGSSPEEPGSEYECLSCATGRPLRYFVLPPTDVTLAAGSPYNEVIHIEVTEDTVNVSTREGDRLSGSVWVYTFSHDFELLSVAAGDDYWPLHRELRLVGKIDHDEDACPWRTPPPVASWSEDSGWTQVIAAR